MATPHRRPPTPKHMNPVRAVPGGDRAAGDRRPVVSGPRSYHPDSPRARPLSANKKITPCPRDPRIEAPKVVHASPRDRVLTPSNNLNRDAKDVKERTINPTKLVPGDRVRIPQSDRNGIAMYVGKAGFAPNKTVVGIKLETKRTTSTCDGKYHQERYFRCEPGYGVYVLLEEVEKLPDSNQAPKASELPPGGQLNLDSALKELVGLDGVKQQLKSIRNWVTVQRRREQVGVLSCKPLHLIFAGTRGTGMTTIGKLLAHMLRDLGVVATGQLITVSAKEVISVGHTGDAEKKVTEWMERAGGGVLAVEDAHLLHSSESRSRDQAGQEALSAITRHLQGDLGTSKQVWPQPFVLVLCGGRAEMNSVLATSALEHFISNQCEFNDFTVDEMVLLVRRLVEKRKFTLDRGVSDAKLNVCVRRAVGQGGAELKNMRLVETILDEAIGRQTDRCFEQNVVSKEGLTKLTDKDFCGDGELAPLQQDPAIEALKQLDNTVGLDEVKLFVKSLYAQLKTEQQRREAGVGTSNIGSLHMVFVGNPGTGKTTIARVVAQLLQKMGMLRNGHLVETDRSSLVAGYCGQTALKTKAVVESAIGGVLFIDEAYALVQGDRDSFGNEALDTLIRLVEEHRNELVCIMAGYRDEMHELLARNPGLKSRFPTTIEFPDYSCEQLMQIAERMLLQDCMILSYDAAPKLQRMLQKLLLAHRPSDIGNARAVRNLLEKAKRRQALRLQKLPGKRSKDDLCQLVAGDFDEKDIAAMQQKVYPRGHRVHGEQPLASLNK